MASYAGVHIPQLPTLVHHSQRQQRVQSTGPLTAQPAADKLCNRSTRAFLHACSILRHPCCCHPHTACLRRDMRDQRTAQSDVCDIAHQHHCVCGRVQAPCDTALTSQQHGSLHKDPHISHQVGTCAADRPPGFGSVSPCSRCGCNRCAGVAKPDANACPASSADLLHTSEVINSTATPQLTTLFWSIQRSVVCKQCLQPLAHSMGRHALAVNNISINQQTNRIVMLSASTCSPRSGCCHPARQPPAGRRPHPTAMPLLDQLHP
jgi:hypothetical protein